MKHNLQFLRTHQKNYKVRRKCLLHPAWISNNSNLVLSIRNLFHSKLRLRNSKARKKFRVAVNRNMIENQESLNY
jgi:hypothetical protein